MKCFDHSVKSPSVCLCVARRQVAFLLLVVFLILPGMTVAGERILALSPNACEMLFAIGAGKDVVGVGEYCDYPEAAGRLPRVANARRIFVEAALRMHPTLIVTADRHIKGLKMLEGRGFRIIVTHPYHFSDIFADLRRLGTVTGHTEKAEDVTGKLEQHFLAVRSKSLHPAPVFFEVWSDPLMTQGKRSFITEVIEAAGGRNIFADTPLETVRVNIEAVLRARPEVIVIPSASGNTSARRKFWRKWLKNVRVIAINPDLISRPGPRLVDGVEVLKKLLMATGPSQQPR